MSETFPWGNKINLGLNFATRSLDRAGGTESVTALVVELVRVRCSRKPHDFRYLNSDAFTKGSARKPLRVSDGVSTPLRSPGLQADRPTPSHLPVTPERHQHPTDVWATIAIRGPHTLTPLRAEANFRTLRRLRKFEFDSKLLTNATTID